MNHIAAPERRIDLVHGEDVEFRRHRHSPKRRRSACRSLRLPSARRRGREPERRSCPRRSPPRPWRSRSSPAPPCWPSARPCAASRAAASRSDPADRARPTALSRRPREKSCFLTAWATSARDRPTQTPRPGNLRLRSGTTALSGPRTKRIRSSGARVSRVTTQVRSGPAPSSGGAAGSRRSCPRLPTPKPACLSSLTAHHAGSPSCSVSPRPHPRLRRGRRDRPRPPSPS